MSRFVFDTAVFLYAFGRPHPLKGPCRRILALAAAGELRGDASADLVQEFAHRRLVSCGDRTVAAEQAGDVAALCRVGDARASDVAQALELYAAHPRLTARDAFFAAFALGRGIGVILSPDRDFDEVPGLQRVDPSDEQAVDALVAP